MNELLDHYEGGRADRYHAHHQKSLRTRMTTARECQLLRQAWRLAGEPSVVLDFPCGTGRFWQAFEQTNLQRLIGADSSAQMLDVAKHNIRPGIDTEIVRTSLFDAEFGDDAIPFTACLRLFHHLADAKDRRRALCELSRITREHLLVSLWTDGNLAAWRRAKRARPTSAGYGRRICRPRKEIEAEFHDAGLRIVHSVSVWPRVSMWRFYLLATGNHG